MFAVCFLTSEKLLFKDGFATKICANDKNGQNA
jgi:hypothetical protein